MSGNSTYNYGGRNRWMIRIRMRDQWKEEEELSVYDSYLINIFVEK
jgi:hypothetical protein